MTETRTATFDLVKLAEFKSRLAKINKVAAKLGVEPVSYVEVERSSRKEAPTWFWAAAQQAGFVAGPCPVELLVEITTITVEITGESPQLPGGWKFLGTVEHAEAGNLIHGAEETDAAVVEQFRTAEPKCDHCGFRRDRKKTVIARNEAGDVVQIGSSCLKDFFGYHGRVEDLSWFSDAVDQFGREDSEFGAYNRTAYGDPTDLVLALVASASRQFGFTPKSYYSGIPTADVVAVALSHWQPKGNQELAERASATINNLTADDIKAAQETREWAQNLDTVESYLLNLRTVVSASFVEPKHLGLASSAISAKQRAEGKEFQRKQVEERKATSEYVGTAGQRQVFDVEVVGVRAFEGDYGTKYLVTFIDPAGNTIKTWNSGKFGREVEKGFRGKIKGTVQKHELYQGNKETTLQRVQVVEWVHQERATVPCGDPVNHAFGRCSCPKEAVQ